MLQKKSVGRRDLHLLKHVQAAVEEILGEFRRLGRLEGKAMIDGCAENAEWYTARPEEVRRLGERGGVGQDLVRVKVRLCLVRVQQLLAGLRAAASEDAVRDIAGLGHDLREVAVCAHGTERGWVLGEAWEKPFVLPLLFAANTSPVPASEEPPPEEWPPVLPVLPVLPVPPLVLPVPAAPVALCGLSK